MAIQLNWHWHGEMITMGYRCWEPSDRDRWRNLFWQQHEW
jgi:hypothetical protein